MTSTVSCQRSPWCCSARKKVAESKRSFLTGIHFGIAFRCSSFLHHTCALLCLRPCCTYLGNNVHHAAFSAYTLRLLASSPTVMTMPEGVLHIGVVKSSPRSSIWVGAAGNPKPPASPYGNTILWFGTSDTMLRMCCQTSVNVREDRAKRHGLLFVTLLTRRFWLLSQSLTSSNVSAKMEGGLRLRMMDCHPTWRDSQDRANGEESGYSRAGQFFR